MRGSARQRPGQPLLHLGAGDRVERGEGLVEGQHRLAGDAGCAGRRRAGACRRRARPARARSKPARPKRSKSCPACAPRLRRGATPRLRSASAALSIAESQGSSRSRWGMKAQRARRPAALAGAADLDLAARRLLQAGDQLEQGRLAAARGPDQAEHAVRRELEVEPLDRRAARRRSGRGRGSRPRRRRARAGRRWRPGGEFSGFAAGILVSWRTPRS